MKAENVLVDDLIKSCLEPLLISLEIRDITFQIKGGTIIYIVINIGLEKPSLIF